MTWKDADRAAKLARGGLAKLERAAETADAEIDTLRARVAELEALVKALVCTRHLSML